MPAYELGSAAAQAARTLRLLSQSGVVAPIRPGRLLRVVSRMLRYGLTVTAGYAAGAARHPDRIAIIDEQGSLTYGQVHSRTDRLARQLALQGLGPGQRIGILCRNHRGPVEVMVAAGKLGTDIVLVNPDLSAGQVVKLIAELDVRLVVADHDLIRLLENIPADVQSLTAWHPDMAGALEQLITSRPGKMPRLPLRPPRGSLIVLTSGTTSTAKGVRRPHPRSILPAGAILSRIPLREGEPVLLAAPLFHVWGHAALHLAVLHGSPVVLHRRFEPEETLSAIAVHGCRALVAVPIMLHRLLELPDTILSGYDCRLRVAAVSGSALVSGTASRFMDLFGDVLYNVYGSTEAACVSIAVPSDVRADPSTVGKPIAGTSVTILDADGRPVSVGVIGRVFVNNKMRFLGYTDVCANLENQNSMIETGDLGWIDVAGRLHLVGRSDDMIVSGGENIHPSQVEELLTSHPGILEAAAVAASDAEYGQRLAVYVVRAPCSSMDAAAVRGLVRDRLARFAVPREVLFVDELPRGETGKVLRRKLGPTRP